MTDETQAPPSDPSELARLGRDAIGRQAWTEARDLLSRADEVGDLSPEDLDSLGEATWWCGRADKSIGIRERAFAGFMATGNKHRAGGTAFHLFWNNSEKHATSVAMGWFKQAERLLEQVPESPEHGFLEYGRTNIAVAMGDLDAAFEHATNTIKIGERLGDPDFQTLGLFDQGNILIAKGELAKGRELLEEAGVSVISGQLSPLITGIIYCSLISTFARLADYGRASEWTDAAERWCEPMSTGGFPGLCRVRRAEIMRLRGAWHDAEKQARQAHEELLHFEVNAAAEALYEVGEIRLRMGDLDAAEDAFRQAHELGREPQPGLALLRLAQGDSAAASALIGRATADVTWDRLARARLLPAQVEIAIADGRLPDARAAALELGEIASVYDTTAIQASAASASGELAAAERDTDGAVADLRRSLRLWQEVDAPYETAKVRLRLASVYGSCNDDSAAQLELDAALAVFQRLGAGLDEKRALEIRERGWQQPAEPAGHDRATKTFMFTDICKSTPLVEAMGDAAWDGILSWHDQALRFLFSEYSGEEVKQQGDGFFVAFDSQLQAIRCAVAIQRALAEHRRDHGFAPDVRIGLHVADATRRASDYSGKGVNRAARIGSHAEAGEILASKDTTSELDGDFSVSLPRSISLKGIADPVEVVSVDWA